MKDVLPCSNNSYMVFNTRDEAIEKIGYIKGLGSAQIERWGEWYFEFVEYADKLKVVELL